MKQTQTLENFTIYENGELVQEPVAVRLGNAAVRHVEVITSRLTHTVGQYATEALNHVDLAFYDCLNHTDMHGEYVRAKQAAAEAAVRSEYGLVE